MLDAVDVGGAPAAENVVFTVDAGPRRGGSLMSLASEDVVGREGAKKEKEALVAMEGSVVELVSLFWSVGRLWDTPRGVDANGLYDGGFRANPGK